MRLLLDSHILLWAVSDDPRLTPAMHAGISGAEALFISAATVWELTIKSGLGKLDLPDDLFENALAAGAQPLPVNWTHAQGVRHLPMHHADPFDRLLISQARMEGLMLVSADRVFTRYDVELLAG